MTYWDVGRNIVCCSTPDPTTESNWVSRNKVHDTTAQQKTHCKPNYLPSLHTRRLFLAWKYLEYTALQNKWQQDQHLVLESHMCNKFYNSKTQERTPIKKHVHRHELNKSRMQKQSHHEINTYRKPATEPEISQSKPQATTQTPEVKKGATRTEAYISIIQTHLRPHTNRHSQKTVFLPILLLLLTRRQKLA